MALPPEHRCHRLGDAASPITLEFFWDLACPFSAKSFKRIVDEVQPWAEAQAEGAVQVIFRQQVQSWHPQSTLMHEALLAAELVDGSKFWQYAAILFKEQEQFFDSQTEDVTRRQFYEKLADLAVTAGLDREAFLGHLKIKGNGGNDVTPLLKYFIKYTRLTGVHVSPTVVVNGLVDNAPSSSWTLQQWQEHLQPLLAKL